MTAIMKLIADRNILLCAIVGLGSCLVHAAKTTTCNTVSASTSAANVQTFQTTTSSTTSVVKTSKVTGTGTTTVTGKAKLVTVTTTSTSTSTSTVSSNDYGAITTILPSAGFTAMADEILGSTLSAAYPTNFVHATVAVRKNRRHWERDQQQKRQDPSTSYPATVYCTVVNVLTAASTTTTTVAAKTVTAPGGTSTVTTTLTTTTTTTTNAGYVASPSTYYAACAFNNLVESVSGMTLSDFPPTVNIFNIDGANNHLDCCTKCTDNKQCAGWHWMVNGDYQQCIGNINGNAGCDPGYVGGQFKLASEGSYAYAVIGNGNCGRWAAFEGN